MKKFLSLSLALLFVITVLVGCSNEEVVPTEPATEAPTVSELDSQYDAGQKYMQEQKYSEAITAFDRVIELDDTRTDVYLLRANAYYELAQTENKKDNLLSAVADYETAISKDTKPEDTKLYDCYASLGKNAVENDKKYDALTYYEKAYELDKSDPYVALMQRRYMFKIGEEQYYSHYNFDFDNTGFVSYGTTIAESPTMKYEISGNSVIIKGDQDSEHRWEYNPQSGVFEDGYYGTVEKVTAKEVFNDYYIFTAEITTMYGGGTLTQNSMNTAADNAYDSWDRLLNAVYDHLIDVIPEDEASALVKAQKEWINDKEAYMDSQSAEYTGGSMYAMVRAQAGADYTKERARELIDMIPEV